MGLVRNEYKMCGEYWCCPEYIGIEQKLIVKVKLAFVSFKMHWCWLETSKTDVM